MPGLTESTLYENLDHTVSLKITYSTLLYILGATFTIPPLPVPMETFYERHVCNGSLTP